MANDNEQLIAAFFKAWTQLDVDAIVSFFTEDAVWDNVPMKPAHGKGQIRKMIDGFMPMSNFRVDITHTAATGNIVMNARTDSFEYKGKSIAIPVAGLFEIRNGKIALWRDYFDLATFTKQMG